MKSGRLTVSVARLILAVCTGLAATAADLPSQFANGAFYSRRDNSGDGVWFGPADGSGETQLTTGGRVRLSPDGTEIAYLQGNIVAGHGIIRVRVLASGADQQLFAQVSQDVAAVAWSLDGTKLIFDYTNGLCSINRDGTGFTNLFSTTADDASPSLRYCDGALAFQNSSSGLVTSGANGQGRAIPNTQPGNVWPVWSNDGRWIAFTDQHDLWKIRPDGSGRTRLTYLTNAADAFAGPIAWTVDSRLVLAGGKVDGQAGLFAVDPSGQGGIALLRQFPQESEVMDVGAVTGIGLTRPPLSASLTHVLPPSPTRVQVFGMPAARYVLEGSTNAQVWVPLDTNVVSQFSFGYSIIQSNAPYLSYRAVPIPEVNVTQYHNHDSRNGLYTDAAFTREAAANLRRDTNFNGTISGGVFAQPLYIENGPGAKAMIIAATESNNVYALDAISGTVLWQTNVGPPVSLANLPCGNINPLGITGTPVVDLPSRALFLDAMTTPDNGVTAKHLIFSINVDTGNINPGWPVDVSATARSGSTVFTSPTQGQRGALAVVGGRVYVPYGGHYGDCVPFHGWLVGVPMDNPGCVKAWATPALAGGAWGVGGVASDGVCPYLVTGNTAQTVTWAGGEAVLRFHSGPVFTNLADYWTPTNWLQLDQTDLDLGGSAALLVDVPGATPSKLAVALGKDANAYLLNRTNLGGISTPLAQDRVSLYSIIQAAATYRTARGTFVVYRANNQTMGCTNIGDLGAFIITPAIPPAISMAWCTTTTGYGSPFVTTTDGTNNMIVWVVGAQGDQRLHAFDGDTGALIYSGGGPAELMAGTRGPTTGIVARGRIFVATDNKVYAFAVPPPIVLANAASTCRAVRSRFNFTNSPGRSFSVVASTNLNAPLTNWSGVGSVTETAPGQFQFTDLQASNYARRHYRVRLP